MNCYSRIITAVVVLAGFVSAGSTMAADRLLPAKTPVESVIDHYVDALQKSENVQVAPQIDALNLLRRLMLDLAGRIPTTAEAKQYSELQSGTRRRDLVDRLLASSDFAYHQRNELDRMLLPGSRNDGEFRKYLLWATRQNRPWDRMFQDMVIGNEQDENQKAAMQFLRTRAGSLDDLTNDTSVVFFGVNVSCAKCHDHPLAEDWKQDHYFGMQSFFSRTYLTKKKVLAEKFYGSLKFKTTKGIEKEARFMFLNGSVTEEPAQALSDEERKKFDEEVKRQQKDDKAGAPRQPDFSPRQELVKLALNEEDTSFFAQNIANRVWRRLFGRGLVEPPDQMHTGNPASHPKLLEWLARDLKTHGYDLRRMIRGIALSQAYSRSSQWTADTEPPSADYFAQASPRIMTPRQYGLSLLLATRNPPHWEQWHSKPPEAWNTEREGLENASGSWASQFEVPVGNYQIPVDEALLFSNSSKIHDDLLRDSGDRLLGYLKEIDETPEAIRVAYWAIMSRPPTSDELTEIRKYLDSRPGNRPMGMKQVVWALITSPEVRFNY